MTINDPHAASQAAAPGEQPVTPDAAAQQPGAVAPAAAAPATSVPAAVAGSGLADGEWHRLHPATPLLKGGVALIAITGIVIANLRERFVELFFGVPSFGDDPLDEIYNRGIAGWALLAVLGVLLLVMAGFYLSWRMHSFRVTPEAVEVRSGILFRTNRKARLDRIQGVNVNRPLFPRLFGAAKLEVGVAGQDANVQLAYLASNHTDALRRDILRLASGQRQGVVTPTAAAAPAAEATDSAAVAVAGVAAEHAVAAPPPAHGVHGLASSVGAIVTTRANEFLAPELDPDAAPPESVVHIPPGRLLGSVLASGFTLVVIALAIAVPIGLINHQYWLFFAFIPALIGGASYYFNRFTKGLRYSIAGTADGVRVGFGLLSTSNETIPPGRIHAIAVTQPLMWRPFGWWMIRINTAGHSATDQSTGATATLLPVGRIDDVERVLALLLPEAELAPVAPRTVAAPHATHQGVDVLAQDAALADPSAVAGTDPEASAVIPPLTAAQERTLSLIEIGLVSKGGADGFTNAPRSARWVRPFSWRRTGFALSGATVLFRRGVISRELLLAPFARVQSVGIDQGPIQRRLGLSGVRLHTVAGPVSASLGAIDSTVAAELFETLSAGAVASGASDNSHHWAAEQAAN